MRIWNLRKYLFLGMMLSILTIWINASYANVPKRGTPCVKGTQDYMSPSGPNKGKVLKCTQRSPHRPYVWTYNGR